MRDEEPECEPRKKLWFQREGERTEKVDEDGWRSHSRRTRRTVWSHVTISDRQRHDLRFPENGNTGERGSGSERNSLFFIPVSDAGGLRQVRRERSGANS